MKLLFDESVDLPIAHHLRDLGYEVQSITEIAPGISDEMVLARAELTGAVLVTIDKDFGELIYRQHQLSQGIILLRLEELPFSQKASILEAIIEQHGSELAGAFTVITQQQVRVRRISTTG
jgi:predicted nuclease of predicted toxin-antitoxin system